MKHKNRILSPLPGFVYACTAGSRLRLRGQMGRERKRLLLWQKKLRIPVWS